MANTVVRYPRTVILTLWIVLICCVIVGSLLPAKSSVIVAIGRLHLSLKALHYCSYTLLALMALVAIRRRSAAVLAALAMILLGASLEFGQKLVPGRSCEIRDMCINGAGVLTGIAIGILSRRIITAASVFREAALRN
jgi:VanZ family protein